MRFHGPTLVVCLLTLVSGCLPTQQGDQPDLSGQDIHLTILHTADIHSRLLPYDLAPVKTDVDLGLAPEAPPYGGVARLAALIHRERANSDRVIHLDSGDQFEGAPIFNLSNGEPEIRWMSLIGPDAVVIGNHEFDKGARLFAQQYLNYGTYPLLAANYIFEDPIDPISNQLGAMARPYVILNVRGLKVGVIGLGNISSLNSIVEGGNSLQIQAIEQNEAIRQWAEVIAPQVDMIVILSHGGLTEDQQLVTGYDDYFPARSNIDEFLNRKQDPWTLVEAPYADGTRHVFIPGVRNLDVIMGGHLHIVLDPSQEIVNPNQPDRKVVLQHSGAFSKYLGRLDLSLHMPSKTDPVERQALGAEVTAHTYHPFPVDAIWCDDEARSWRSQLSTDDFRTAIQPRIQACINQEDRLTTWLLEPYIINQTVGLELPRIFAFAPKDIDRRNTGASGDSPLGNLTAESMRVRKRVEAEFALTNTLGIRDNLYAGPINLEDMFNVFPFENTINIMYLSGQEMHELFDFASQSSADRGCQSQGQIAGARFIMDCAQALDNEADHPCVVASDCQANYPRADDDIRSPWECTYPNGGNTGVCYAEPSYGISINDQPLDPSGQYKIAVNNYIAQGGSGFKVLRRNTTKIETGISLRDGLVEYFTDQCTCDDINKGATASVAGLPCATVIGYNNDGIIAHNPDGSVVRSVDPVVSGYCVTAAKYADWLAHTLKPDAVKNSAKLTNGVCTCTQVQAATNPDGSATNPDANDPCVSGDMLNLCSAPPLFAGKCNCLDVLINNEFACGHITPELESFCQLPTQMPIVVGESDGRIGARVQ
jgi:2',3'-cyclic-nucleotide 2'-phosphodiesterase (5'-nucleotidase family)